MKLVYNFDGSAIPMWVQLLFWLLYMVVFAYAFKKTLLSWHRNKRFKDVTWLFAFCFTLYAIFYCINDDYFSYRDWVFGSNFEFWHKEYVYVFIIYLCRSLPFSYPYEIFRFIVWGGAVFIAYYTFRMYRTLLIPGMVLLLLFVFYSNVFCYARASLAMAVFFLGLAILLTSKGFSMTILGIVIAISSVFFHREMLVGVAVLPSLFIPLEKKENACLSVFLLVYVILCISLVIPLVDFDFEFFKAIFDDDDLSNKLEDFSNKEQGSFRISTLIKYLTFFYPFYFITVLFWKIEVPHSIVGFYRITYSILLISVVFMIVFGLRSVYSYRIMYISMIPLSILTGFCYCNGYLKRIQFLIMMMLSFLSNSTRFINA